MCYRCDVCSGVVPSRVPRMVHTIQRPKGNGQKGLEIERELGLCRECKEALGLGLPLATLLRQHGRPIRLYKPPPSRPVKVGKPIPAWKPNPNGR